MLRGVTALRHFPAEPAEYRDFPEHIEAPLREAYRQKGVEQLYSHQREVLDRVENGEDVAVVTPTASGKTLCYNAPVLNRILREPDARALYLFPTKGAFAGPAEGNPGAEGPPRRGHPRRCL